MASPTDVRELLEGACRALKAAEALAGELGNDPLQDGINYAIVEVEALIDQAKAIEARRVP